MFWICSSLCGVGYSQTFRWAQVSLLAPHPANYCWTTVGAGKGNISQPGPLKCGLHDNSSRRTWKSWHPTILHRFALIWFSSLWDSRFLDISTIICYGCWRWRHCFRNSYSYVSTHDSLPISPQKDLSQDTPEVPQIDYNKTPDEKNRLNPCFRTHTLVILILFFP